MQRKHNPQPSAGAAESGPRPSPRVLGFAGTGLQVIVEDAEPVANALGLILQGWSPQPVGRIDPQARVSSVLGHDGVYAANSSYLNETIHGLGVAGAACAVIADLAEDYFGTRPGCLALHCAAFQFSGRLIAMTGPRRAGKSTLAARITQETDMALFCDDVLPLLPNGQAIGLGIAPRLRLPLPDRCSPAFRAHVARHQGPSDDRYAYLCAPTVAPHGTQMPLSVLLILDRRPTGDAALHAVADDEALHFLLAQNMANLQTADAAFTRLSEVLGQITCLRLVYADLEDAIRLIRAAFGGTAEIDGSVSIGPALPRATPSRLPTTDLSPDLCWARDPDAVLQAKGDAAFLWLAGRQVIWHMNTLALTVWSLLEIPGSARDIAQVLAEHFPDQPEATLVRDVNALFQALAQNGLIAAAD